MISLKTRIKAHSVLEYAIVITCIAAALLVMQVYIKRGMQGRLRQSGDSFGQQYDPRNTTGVTTITSNSDITTVVAVKNEKELGMDIDRDGRSLEEDVYASETTSVINKESTTQISNETVGPMGEGLYEYTAVGNTTSAESVKSAIVEDDVFAAKGASIIEKWRNGINSLIQETF